MRRAAPLWCGIVFGKLGGERGESDNRTELHRGCMSVDAVLSFAPEMRVFSFTFWHREFTVVDATTTLSFRSLLAIAFYKYKNVVCFDFICSCFVVLR